MKIDKDQILELLRSQGKHNEAKQASKDLPDKVDTDDETHQSVLSKFGVDPSELGKTLGLDKFL
jgi:hypothetical protein